MIILGIESSCDETSVAILEQKNKRIQILSNVVASSALIQSKYGGIIPEQAAREQIRSIIPVLNEALEQAGLKPSQIDAIAVTEGPGLIGSLLIGVETAKVLSLTWNKPLIPVNHLIGHFYANWVEGSNLPSTGKIQTNPHSADDLKYFLPRDPKQKPPTFPCIGLLVSGGHTDLVLFKDHGQYEYLGGTRDDAAGECFDKCARLLDLPYPGGPQISKLAKEGDPNSFDLPRPMWDSGDFDFSFSGLKTAVSNLLKVSPQIKKADLCASIEEAIIDILVQKTVKAAKLHNIEQIIVAGGVAANQKLKSKLKEALEKHIPSAMLFIPTPALCTDNAAMITSAAFFQKPTKDILRIQADPNLSLAY